jgi:histidine triad (HIT) family protein
VSGEIPCYKIAENEEFLAFLDITPLRKGHTLVIPKKETDYIFDIDDEHLAEFILFAKVVANKIKAAIPCKKVGMTVIGLEVPHAHIHLIPMHSIADMDFSQSKLVLDAEEMKAIAQLIANQ